MTIYTITLTLGIAATAIFLAGFVKGLVNAISEYRQGTAESNGVPDEKLGGTAVISVIASAVIIASIGFSPSLVYLGPLLAIGTALACGAAFFLEKRQ